MSEFILNLHEVVHALSDALDLVGVDHIHHGKRVAYIASECGAALGWDTETQNRLIQAAILHDCGVSSTRTHHQLLDMAWEGEHDHCLLGGQMLRAVPMLAPLADVVLHHHTHWDARPPESSMDATTALLANCIYLADRVDVQVTRLRREEPNVLLLRAQVYASVRQYRGSWFAPALVQAFEQVSLPEVFWFSMDNEHAAGYVAQWVQDGCAQSVAFAQVRELVAMFSAIVDNKSSFTAEHSEGVARLARYLGGQCGFDEHTLDQLELAGLLHDLGKLRVPDAVLDKNGKLDQQEYATVQRHSFDTFNILSRVNGFEQIALWAGMHHERLNGSGYPYHRTATQLPLEARIVAVADVYQALAQTRPYRRALSIPEIQSILDDEVHSGKLDARLVQLIAQHPQSAMLHATGRQAHAD
ncbi:MAG: HD domain-containing protein [Burkholderiales bacterium]|nr:HD domain-containing protein [Burkholderiales bacterium]MBK9346236.1 HD domain-containing protein [Burkholderiales bacterium]